MTLTIERLAITRAAAQVLAARHGGTHLDTGAFFARLVGQETAGMYPKQEAAIYDPARYAVIEASTKTGKTAGCLKWLMDQARSLAAGQNVWWVAPVFGQSDIAFRRMRRALGPSVAANETKMTITLPSGVVIWFKSGEKPDNLYGEDVYAAVIDEATRLREEAWHAIRTTLTATEGPARIIGNVKGRRNWAYQMARRAEAGEPNMAYHRLIAADAIEAGILSEAEVEDARRQLPDNVYRELYLAEPSEDGGNPFGHQYIQACIAPLSTAEPAAWGWDLAKSVDWTVGIALDADGATCRHQRFQHSWETTISVIRQETGSVKALVDSTGVGDPVLEALQKGSGNYEGYKFTAESKQKLMEGLALAIQRGEVRYPDGPIVAELEAFEYEHSRTGVHYSAPEGMHDDCVCALALAVHKRGRARTLEWA